MIDATHADYQVLIEGMGPKENLIHHIANVLDMLLPIWGPQIQHIGPGNWPHVEDLGVEIADWMDEVARKRPDIDPILEHDFEKRLSLVRVRLQHLLGDFWLLKTYHADFNRQGGIEVVDGPAAHAFLRIDGSGARVLNEKSL